MAGKKIPGPGVRLALGALLALSSAACAMGSPGKTYTVTIENLQFNPQALSVHAGDTVVWVNKDLFPHTVTASAKAFDSGGIAANASWTYVAAKSGNYAYGCTFHPTMKGRLTVQ